MYEAYANQTALKAKSFPGSRFHYPRLKHAIKRIKRVATPPHTTSCFAPPAATTTLEHESQLLANRGNVTYQRMLDAINDPNKHDTGPNSIEEKKWRTQSGPLSESFLSIHAGEAIDSLNLQSQRDTFTRIRNVALRNDKGIRAPASSLFYDNYYSGPASMIIAANNKGKFGEEPDVQRAPNRWCDVAFNMYRDKTGHTDINYIFQDLIANPITHHVMNELKPETAEFDNLEIYCIDYTPRDGDRFFALLQSPNAVGAPYMM